MSLKPRQRSEISLSFASVLVISAKVRMFSLKVLASAFERRILEPVQLEREEQQMQRGGGNLFLDVAIEFRARRIDRVAGMHEPRIGDDAAEQIVERLVALDRLDQFPRGGNGGEPAP